MYRGGLPAGNQSFRVDFLLQSAYVVGDLTDLQCCRSRRVGCHGLLLYKSYARVLARYFVCRIDQKNTQEKKECIDTFCWVTVDTLTDFPARHLLVLSIEEGTVQEYNTKNPENAVQEGDHIVSVNGSSQDTEMVRQFRSAPFLLIVFRRTEAKVVEKRKLRLEDLRRRLGESLRISPAV